MTSPRRAPFWSAIKVPRRGAGAPWGRARRVRGGGPAGGSGLPASFARVPRAAGGAWRKQVTMPVIASFTPKLLNLLPAIPALTMRFQTSWTEASQHGGADGDGHSGRARPPAVLRTHLQWIPTPSRAACSSTVDPDPLQGSVLVHSGARPHPGQRARPQRSPTPSRAACSSTAEPDPHQCCVPIHSGARPPPGQRARPQRSPTPSRAACSSTVEPDPLQCCVPIHSGAVPPPGQRAHPQQQHRAIHPWDMRSSTLRCRHTKEVETVFSGFGRAQQYVLLRNYLLYVRREIQPHRLIGDEPGLPVSGGVGPRHGVLAHRDPPGEASGATALTFPCFH
ncbi:uncharacterized protein LOC129555930 [Moschus berezovskii]|uniref:uncharacterized protein LOC129555930 n=1 Tax=Moschus berezovskii TaxID=68408 RepID=UPI00244382D1|nr:uncharacterized protein LOC129555930 [Moschus berezovskii]